jgi:uncharacterized damage-inducible protein DinB
VAILRSILGEIQHESQGTLTILERVPTDKLEWTPHPKSMSLGKLASHIATLPAGCRRMLESGRFDVTGARPPVPVDMPAAEIYRKNIADLREYLATLDEATLMDKFAMVRGDQVLREMTKGIMLRMIFLNHSVHHRGQLSVYLRLLDVPLPALYGTSADENPFA